MSTLLKFLAVAILIWLALTVSRCAESYDRHYIDSNNISGSTTFASHDTNPITVNFVDMRERDKVLMLVALPRTPVISFAPYATRSTSPSHTVQKLPEIVYGEGPLTLLYLHGTETPYLHINLREIDKYAGVNDGSFGMDYASQRFEKKLPWLTGVAEVMFLHSRQITEGIGTARGVFACPDHQTCNRPYSSANRIGDYEGFAEYKVKQGSGHYYVDDGRDEIREIYCLGSAEQSRPQFFCDYHFPLNDRLYVKLQFIDFRLHGGREFARKRIRAFKEKFCSHLHCDDRALAAAGLQ